MKSTRPATRREVITIAAILTLCFALAAVLILAPPEIAEPLTAGLEALALTAAMISAGSRAWLIFRRGSMVLGGLLWMLAVFLMLLSLPAWGTLAGQL